MVEARIGGGAGMTPVAALVRLFWEMSDVTVAVLTLDGRGVLEVNDAVEELTGIPRAEVTRLDGLEGIWAEVGELPQLLETIEATGVLAGHPFSVTHRDGEPRYGHLWARRCTVDGGDGLVLVARESTEALRTEKLLAAEHAVAAVLDRAESPADAAERLVGALGERLGWDAGVWWAATDAKAGEDGVADGDSGRLEATHLWTAAPFEAEVPSARAALTPAVLGVTVEGQAGLAGGALARGRPLWSEDLAAAASGGPAGGEAGPGGGRHAAALAGAGLRTAMAFPVRGRGRTWGVAELLTRERLPRDDALLESAEVLGRNAALVLCALTRG